MTFAVNIAESAEVGQPVSSAFVVAYGSDQAWRSQTAVVTLAPRKTLWLPLVLRNRK